MPIDLVIDEREGSGKDGDSNNNANRSTADSTSLTDGASTPDMVSNISAKKHYVFLPQKKRFDIGSDAKRVIYIAVVSFSLQSYVSSYDNKWICLQMTAISRNETVTDLFLQLILVSYANLRP